MTDSILDSIKKLLGLPTSATPFDDQLVIFINSALSTLFQLGLGPVDGFMITGKDETWTQFIGDDKTIQQVKQLVYLKVRLTFDPPTTSFVIEAFEKQVAELEWRLNVRAEEVNASSTI